MLLMILTLVVQLSSKALPASLPVYVKLPFSYKVQRSWRSGTFNFDSAQFEPTEWEWQRTMNKPINQRRRFASFEKVEVKPKLLWKVENRYEDYDSLMEMEDHMVISPERKLCKYGAKCSEHYENSIKHGVKRTPPLLDNVFAIKQTKDNLGSLQQHQNHAEQNSYDSEELRNDSGECICEICGGIITTTQMSILTNDLSAQPSNQVLSIELHPATENNSEAINVPSNPQAHVGRYRYAYRQHTLETTSTEQSTPTFTTSLIDVSSSLARSFDDRKKRSDNIDGERIGNDCYTSKRKVDRVSSVSSEHNTNPNTMLYSPHIPVGSTLSSTSNIAIDVSSSCTQEISTTPIIEVLLPANITSTTIPNTMGSPSQAMDTLTVNVTQTTAVMRTVVSNSTDVLTKEDLVKNDLEVKPTSGTLPSMNEHNESMVEYTTQEPIVVVTYTPETIVEASSISVKRTTQVATTNASNLFNYSDSIVSNNLTLRKENHKLLFANETSNVKIDVTPENSLKVLMETTETTAIVNVTITTQSTVIATDGFPKSINFVKDHEENNEKDVEEGEEKVVEEKEEELPKQDGIFAILNYIISALLESILRAIVYLFTDTSSTLSQEIMSSREMINENFRR